MVISPGTPRGYLDEQSQKRFLGAMDEASAIIDGFVEEIQTFGVSGKTVTRGSALDPTGIFESLDIHHEIKSASGKLFSDGHYAQSILEAYKALNNCVKAKSGKTELDGKSLMSTVFSRDSPILALNSLSSTSDKDEQEGFMLLYMGAMVGIRNPKAHEIVRQDDPLKTLEYLALASLLARRVDEARKLRD